MARVLAEILDASVFPRVRDPDIIYLDIPETL